MVLTLTSGVGMEEEGERSSVDVSSDAIVVTVEARGSTESVNVALLVNTPDSVVTGSIASSVDSGTKSLEEVKPAVVTDESTVDGESVIVNTVVGGSEEEVIEGSDDSVVEEM